MLDHFRTGLVLLACSSLAAAQNGHGYSGYGDGDTGSDGGNYASDYSDFDSFISSKRTVVIAHAVLGSAAFVLLFPIGSILIRVGNFRGLWLVHAVLQAFAFIVYIAAFGLGVYIAADRGMLRLAHPIIGIVLFALLFFQPILGFLHHFMFRKHSRRVVWSYGHIWLGRIIITLGIINGGLGLQLAQQTTIFAPSSHAIIAYSVVAAIMWLVYVVCAVVGEIRRSRAQKSGAAPPYKETEETSPSAPNGAGEYYRNQRSGQVYA